MPTRLTTEARFLLLSAGGAENDASLLDLAARPIDWDVLASLARSNGATAVIWRRLQRLGCAVPAAIAETMHRETVVAEFELLRARARLAETVAAFDGAGIRVVLLKGAALAHTVYRSFEQRPMRDFDLLVDAARIDEAGEIAATCGWTRSAGAAPDSAYEAHHHVAPLVDTRGTRMHLELHSSLFMEGSPFELSPALIRARSRPVEIGDCLVGVPTRSLLLLHACLHFAWSHSMRSAGWRTIRDVGQLVSTGAARWDEFTRMAIASRGSTCCYWTLRLANECARIPVPAGVLAALAPPIPELVRSRLARHFALHFFAREEACPSASLEIRAWNAAVQPVWSGHGDARPWDRTAEFAGAGAVATDERAARSGLARHFERIPAWQRYLGHVLLGRPGPTS